MLSGFLALATFDIASVAIPFTPCFSVIVRSPKHDVSLTRDYVPTAGPGDMSLGADVEVTTRTPDPTGDIINSLPVEVLVVDVGPVGGATAYGD